MKKLMLLLLSLMLMLTCAAGAEAADFTGEWLLAEVSKGGTTVDMAMMGLTASMQINADGTSVLTMMDEPDTGTWTLSDNGIVVTDASGAAANFVWDGEKLTTEMRGLTMAFKQAEKEAAFSYAGKWVLTGAEMGGSPVDLAMLGITADIVLNADGTCVLTMVNDVQAASWTATENGIATTDVEGVVDAYTLVDGKLVAEQGGVTMIFSKTEEAPAAVAAPADAAKYLGDWQVTRAKAAGYEYDPTTLGLIITLHVYEDGTCKMVSMGNAEMCTWAAVEGGIAVTDSNGDTVVFALANGELSAEQDGVLMAFTPMAAAEEAPAADVPAAEPTAAPAAEDETVYASPVANLTLADFAGDWAFAYAEYMGMVLAPEDVGMSIDLRIEGETGRMEITYEDGSEAYDAYLVSEEAEGLGTLVYFVYTYTDPSTGETGEYYFTLIMYDNGELVWYDDDGQGNAIYYCFELTGLGEEAAE